MLLYQLIADIAAIAKQNYNLRNGTVELFYYTRDTARGTAINGELYVAKRKRPYMYAGLFH